mmetsp:Transcript_16123/g.50288  ORF Transcript_16123/g.50288 Transcript_16123/m.50288 type:complete len:344 (-) Transcript_16123:358-1389(-)
MLDDVKNRQPVVLDRAVFRLVGCLAAHGPRDVHYAADVGRRPVSLVRDAETHRNLDFAALIGHVLAGRDRDRHCLRLLHILVLLPIVRPVVVALMVPSFQLAVQLVLEVPMPRRHLVGQLRSAAVLNLCAPATLEHALDALHGRAADGAAARVALNGLETLLAPALVSAGHDQVVGGCVKTDGAGTPLLCSCLAAPSLARCRCSLEAPDHALKDLCGLKGSLDAPDLAGEHRQDPAALALEDVDALPEGTLVIPFAAHEAVGYLRGRRCVLEVIDVSCLWVNPAVCRPPDERLVGHVQHKDTVHPDLSQQGFGLVAGAGEAIEQTPALLHIVLAEAVTDETQD